MAVNVIQAVIDRYETFPIAATCPIWFDSTPAANAGGTVIIPPYVLLKDDGTVPDYDFEENPFELTQVRFEIYQSSMVLAKATVMGIRLNGGAINAELGMDFGTLTITGETVLEMLWKRTQYSIDRNRGPGGDDIYRATMQYGIRTVRTA